METEAAEPGVSGVHLGRDVNAAPGTLNVLAMSRTGFPSASNCAATCALHQGRGHRSSPEAAGASLPGRHSNSPISACLASPVCPASPASPASPACPAVSARLACLAVSDPCFPPFRLPKKPKFLSPYRRGHAPPLKTRTHARNGTCSPPSQSGFAPLDWHPKPGECVQNLPLRVQNQHRNGHSRVIRAAGYF